MRTVGKKKCDEEAQQCWFITRAQQAPLPLVPFYFATLSNGELRLREEKGSGQHHRVGKCQSF